ncbi:MAG: arginine--tRNA ligase [Bacteroidetes bacterium]|nr:MAG: arginine--tRNA ligase [Bacteroidota bacterium]
MDLVNQIRQATQELIYSKFQLRVDARDILVNETKPEFEGDYTVVLFSFVKILKKNPETLGNELGQLLTERYSHLFSGFNVIKGFLNLGIADKVLVDFLYEESGNKDFGRKNKTGKKVMVEYSSPNTNKPLHLGHLRNNFLGWSVASIYQANGYEIVKTCIANDRGIHICKSMIAWQMFANGATPESTGIKGDHFVGDYYVMFSNEYKKQMKDLVAEGMTEEEAEKEAPIMKAAQKMLVDWEAGDPTVIELWKKMNGWVYQGFDITYKRIGSDFDKIYYESQTYLLGKDLVEDGLRKNVFFKKEDGSVWIDLTSDGLDQKIVQRKDGTAVYITQDIGLIVNKYDEFHCDQSIYVVGDEQNYHFKVLKLIAQKLALPSSDGIYHLSYGMVELPSGRMKAREGTVVDADDLIDEMVRIAQTHTEELGKVQDFTASELTELYDTIGLGALKFYLLRVDPKKKMLFNPEESIDFHGFTGPFVQYTYARIKSILRKEELDANIQLSGKGLLPLEKGVIKLLARYPAMIEQACLEMNPSVIANYAFSLAKSFNSFYTEHSVSRAESEEKKLLRLHLCTLTARVLHSAMGILGIKVPDRM